MMSFFPDMSEKAFGCLPFLVLFVAIFGFFMAAMVGVVVLVAKLFLFLFASAGAGMVLLCATLLAISILVLVVLVLRFFHDDQERHQLYDDDYGLWDDEDLEEEEPNLDINPAVTRRDFVPAPSRKKPGPKNKS